MEKLKAWQPKNIQYIFTDIDDTLTSHGLLPANSYESLWKLHTAGIKIIPITGRPAGWCEMIARMWPVDGIIGENGGFYFSYDRNLKNMKRHFFFNKDIRKENQKKLNIIREEVLETIPGSAIASDQFTRLMDLAIDFCEDVPPLPKQEVQKIVDVFTKHGAQAKISSIHVNGWFGNYNKLSMCKAFTKNELGHDLEEINSQCAFTGDSPNDEPMFDFFENSIAVANINQFIDQLNSLPKYVCNNSGGDGFVEFSDLLLANT